MKNLLKTTLIMKCFQFLHSAKLKIEGPILQISFYSTTPFSKNNTPSFQKLRTWIPPLETQTIEEIIPAETRAAFEKLINNPKAKQYYAHIIETKISAECYLIKLLFGPPNLHQEWLYN